MSNIMIQTLAIALIISISCAYLGSFLFLRKMILITDALSHTVLLGIVVTYIIVQDMASMWMLFGASVVGVITVVMIESLTKIKLMKEDAAIATVYAFLFSVSIALISTHLRHTLLSKYALFGNLEFAAFRQVNVFGNIEVSLTLIYSAMLLLVLFILGTLFFKQLMITTFDALYAAHAGITVILVHYGLMSLVSLTIVSSFQALGVILVITMMVAPIATVHFYVLSIRKRIALAIVIAMFNVLLGFFIAIVVLEARANIASTIAAVSFFTFVLSWIFSPHQGLFAIVLRKQSLQNKIYRDFIFKILVPLQAEGVPKYVFYQQGLCAKKISQTIQVMLKAGWISKSEDKFYITSTGVSKCSVM